MRRTVLIAAGFLVLAALASWSGAASAREAGPASAARSPDEAEAAGASREHQGAGPLQHRDQVRLAAVRVHRRARPARRLRCRDRSLVFPVRVRQGEPRDVHVRDDACARACAHVRPGRHGDRHLHVHSRSGHPDRLLPGVLQGDRPPARSECRAGQLRLPAGGEDDLDDHGSIYDRW